MNLIIYSCHGKINSMLAKAKKRGVNLYTRNKSQFMSCVKFLMNISDFFSMCLIVFH